MLEPALDALLAEPPDPERPYVYRGTKTHVNYFGILNPEALERVIRTVTELRLKLLQREPIAGRFDITHLSAVHHYLFQDVYAWAGQLRMIDFAHSKFDYAKARDIPGLCRQVFDDLAADGWLRGLSQLEFSDRLARYLGRLYLIHPFREGNGRALRAFLDQLAREAGWRFSLDSIPQMERHDSAAIYSRFGNLTPLIEVVRRVVRPLEPRAEWSPPAS